MSDRNLIKMHMQYILVLKTVFSSYLFQQKQEGEEDDDSTLEARCQDWTANHVEQSGLHEAEPPIQLLRPKQLVEKPENTVALRITRILFRVIYTIPCMHACIYYYYNSCYGKTFKRKQ